MWRNYNPNPLAARVGDCSVRAVCKATGMDWENAFLQMAAVGLDMCDMPSSNNVWGAILRKNGFERLARTATVWRTFAGNTPEGFMC